jgi:hypothetical protein
MVIAWEKFSKQKLILFLIYCARKPNLLFVRVRHGGKDQEQLRDEKRGRILTSSKEFGPFCGSAQLANSRGAKDRQYSCHDAKEADDRDRAKRGSRKIIQW